MTKQEFHQNSFYPVGINLWNALDASFKHVNTLSSTGDRYWNLILKNTNEL